MTDHQPECRWPRYMVVCVGCGRRQMYRPNSYEQGQRDALAEAVQRIKALPWTSDTWLAHAERAAIIAAIKGDQP